MDTRRWFAPIAGMLTGTAWVALWLWEQSPYGRYLDHPRWTEIGMPQRSAGLCRRVTLFCRQSSTPAVGC